MHFFRRSLHSLTDPWNFWEEAWLQRQPNKLISTIYGISTIMGFVLFGVKVYGVRCNHPIQIRCCNRNTSLVIMMTKPWKCRVDLVLIPLKMHWSVENNNIMIILLRYWLSKCIIVGATSISFWRICSTLIDDRRHPTVRLLLLRISNAWPMVLSKSKVAA